MAVGRGASAPYIAISIYEGIVAPTSGQIGDQWMDSAVSPPLFKVCTATSPVTWVTYSTAGSDQEPLQFQEDGSNLGASGTVTTVNFTGAGVTASRASNIVTVDVPVPATSFFGMTKWSVD